MTHLAAAVRTPTGPAFTVVLVCHVAAVLVALVAVVAGAVAALRVLRALRAGGDVPPSVRSYFSPGINWTGRVLYLVPVFGEALVAMSGGAYRPGAPWVVSGIGLWLAAALLAEVVMWPAERKVQRGLVAPAASDVSSQVLTACRAMCIGAAGVVVLVVVAMVVMFAKP